MTVTEIKTRLHGIIDGIEDEQLLKAMYEWLSEKQSTMYTTTGYKVTEEEFIANVREAESDIDQGNTLTHEEVISRLRSRLSAR